MSSLNVVFTALLVSRIK